MTINVFTITDIWLRNECEGFKHHVTDMKKLKTQ